MGHEGFVDAFSEERITLWIIATKVEKFYDTGKSNESNDKQLKKVRDIHTFVQMYDLPSMRQICHFFQK